MALTAQGISSLMVPSLRGARPTGAAVFRVIGELARDAGLVGIVSMVTFLVRILLHVDLECVCILTPSP